MSDLDLILKSGTVFLRNERIETDVGIKNGKIVSFGSLDNAEEIIDCKNLFIFPGLIDTQCHFREPGGEHKDLVVSTKKHLKQGLNPQL